MGVGCFYHWSVNWRIGYWLLRLTLVLQSPIKEKPTNQWEHDQSNVYANGQKAFWSTNQGCHELNETQSIIALKLIQKFASKMMRFFVEKLVNKLQKICAKIRAKNHLAKSNWKPWNKHAKSGGGTIPHDRFLQG